MAGQWHVARLKPGGSQAYRHDTRITNIEYSLQNAGIEHYLPSERKEVIHHRRKVWIDKRYPLIPGYVFIANVEDWLKFHKCDFIASVLGVQGTPISIPESSIDMLRKAENDIFEMYQYRKALRIQAEKAKEERKKHIPQSKARVLYPAGSTVVVDKTHFLLGGYKGRVVDATGRQTIKLMVETLNGIVAAELSMVHLERVA